MKKSIALLGFSLSAGFYLAAQASNHDAVCQSLSSEISAHSNLFLELNDSNSFAKTVVVYTPDLALRRIQNRDASLQNEANEIWSLRARMVNMDCAQADSFTY